MRGFVSYPGYVVYSIYALIYFSLSFSTAGTTIDFIYYRKSMVLLRDTITRGRLGPTGLQFAPTHRRRKQSLVGGGGGGGLNCFAVLPFKYIDTLKYAHKLTMLIHYFI